jgi:hypothetical protein
MATRSLCGGSEVYFMKKSSRRVLDLYTAREKVSMSYWPVIPGLYTVTSER